MPTTYSSVSGLPEYEVPGLDEAEDLKQEDPKKPEPAKEPETPDAPDAPEEPDEPSKDGDTIESGVDNIELRPEGEDVVDTDFEPIDVDEILIALRAEIGEVAKRVEHLLVAQPRAMALKMAIEALPSANPADHVARATQYLEYLKAN